MNMNIEASGQCQLLSSSVPTLYFETVSGNKLRSLIHPGWMTTEIQASGFTPLFHHNPELMW